MLFQLLNWENEMSVAFIYIVRWSRRTHFYSFAWSWLDWVHVTTSDITSGLVVFKASNVMVAGWLMSENSRQSLHFIGVQWSARMNWANPIIRRSRDQIFLHECWSHECKKVTWVWKAILIFPMLWFRRCDENKILPFVALLLVVDSKPWSIPVRAIC